MCCFKGSEASALGALLESTVLIWLQLLSPGYAQECSPGLRDQNHRNGRACRPAGETTVRAATGMVRKVRTAWLRQSGEGCDETRAWRADHGGRAPRTWAWNSFPRQWGAIGGLVSGSWNIHSPDKWRPGAWIFTWNATDCPFPSLSLGSSWFVCFVLF